MVNEHYEPDAVEDRVIELLRDEHRVNAPRVVDRTDLSRADVNHALRNLATAGWCRKVARGLYEYVEDPRRDELDVTPDPDGLQDGPTGAAGSARLALQEWDPEDVDSAKAREAVVRVVEWLDQRAPEGGSGRSNRGGRGRETGPQNQYSGQHR